MGKVANAYNVAIMEGIRKNILTVNYLFKFLTLFNPAFLVLNLLGGGQICPHPLKMGVMGGRFQN